MNREHVPVQSGLRLAAVAAAAGLLLGGSDMVPEPTIPQWALTPSLPDHSTAATSGEIWTPIPAPACEAPAPQDPKAKQKALRCAQALAHGTIAVVDFDANPTVFNGIVDTLGSSMSMATGGKVNLKTVPVTATAEAKTELAEAEALNGCIPAADGSYPSSIADWAMPQLHKYDFVLAVSSTVSCAPDIGGQEHGGRQADVYIGKPGHQTEGLRELEGSAAHETGHLVTWGHYGQLGSEKFGDQMQDPSFPPGYALGKPVDLKAYLTGVYGDISYWEYGDLARNIMGAPLDPSLIVPDATQEAVLDWPAVVLGKEPSPIERITGTPLVFDEKAVRQHKVAALPLEEPLTFVDATTKKNMADTAGTQTFNMLVVEPGISKGKNFGVHLFLANEHNVLAELGWLSPPKPPCKGDTVISYGSQRIKVTVASSKTVLQLLPAANR